MLGSGTSTQVEVRVWGLNWTRQGELFPSSQAAANPAAPCCSPPPFLTGSSLGAGAHVVKDGGSSLWCSHHLVGSQMRPGAPISSSQPHHCSLLGQACKGRIDADRLDSVLLGNLCSNTEGPTAGSLAHEVEARCTGTFYLVPESLWPWGHYWGDLLWHIDRATTFFDIMCATSLQHCLLDYLPVAAEVSPQS